jgi:putative ABC transport system permease protein
MSRALAYLTLACESLWRNKARTFLTMLGMIIGSSSIITVFGISKAATSGIAGTFASFGTIPVMVQVDDSQNFPARAQFRYDDVAAIAAAIGDEAHDVVPSWVREWKITYGNTTSYLNVGTTGTFQDDSLTMNEGRKIDANDVDSAARVVALTQSVADKFFPNGDALGKDLTMNGARYTIVGIYAPINSPLISSLGGSDYVVIPYTTFYRALDVPPDEIDVYPVKGVSADTLRSTIVDTLQHIHGEQAQYQVIDGAQVLGTFETVLDIAGMSLGAIGGVALIVAGIGIMNIMLVTVAERTREIGIRKSIGASRADVMLQFLMESLVLALLGGMTGMLLGIAVTALGANLLSSELGTLAVPYALVVAIALAFSGGTGMIFGLYPAYRAATLDPIEALRG